METQRKTTTPETTNRFGAGFILVIVLAVIVMIIAALAGSGALHHTDAASSMKGPGTPDFGPEFIPVQDNHIYTGPTPGFDAEALPPLGGELGTGPGGTAPNNGNGAAGTSNPELTEASGQLNTGQVSAPARIIYRDDFTVVVTPFKQDCKLVTEVTNTSTDDAVIDVVYLDSDSTIIGSDTFKVKSGKTYYQLASQRADRVIVGVGGIQLYNELVDITNRPECTHPAVLLPPAVIGG